MASDMKAEKTASTSDWIIEVIDFESGLQEAKWGGQSLFTAKQDNFKNKQFVRIEGIIKPVAQKDKYTFDFKLKLNGEQNLIIVELVDKEGKGFVAFGDERKFDRSPTNEFNFEQFPMKISICFYLPADIKAFDFSINDSDPIKLNNL